MKIYLYIKTHNSTGLKYFGKTIQLNVEKYRGSGTVWLNHIKKHGYNVSTEIIACFEDIEKCKEFAYDFSIKNDIVNSSEWANLEIERIEGYGNFKNKEVLEKARETRRKNQTSIEFDKTISKLGRKKVIENKLGYLNPKNQMKGVEKALTEDARKKRLEKLKEIKHQQGERNNQFGTHWITDGVSNKKIKNNENIPIGWRLGRVV